MNCIECNDLNCTKCNGSFILNDDDYDCITQSRCSRENYVVIDNETCTKCLNVFKNCFSCDSLKCKTCQPGFYMT